MLLKPKMIRSVKATTIVLNLLRSFQIHASSNQMFKLKQILMTYHLITIIAIILNKANALVSNRMEHVF